MKECSSSVGEIANVRWQSYNYKIISYIMRILRFGLYFLGLFSMHYKNQNPTKLNKNISLQAKL